MPRPGGDWLIAFVIIISPFRESCQRLFAGIKVLEFISAMKWRRVPGSRIIATTCTVHGVDYFKLQNTPYIVPGKPCLHPTFENPAYITATKPFRSQSRIFVIETLHISAHEFSLMV